MSQFLRMGGYGVYIWPCYILCVIMFVWHVYRAIVNNAKTKAKIMRDYIGSSSDQNA